MRGGGMGRQDPVDPRGAVVCVGPRPPFRLLAGSPRAFDLASSEREWDGEKSLAMATDDLMKTGQSESVASSPVRIASIVLAGA